MVIYSLQCYFGWYLPVYKTELYSKKLTNTHFGYHQCLFYALPMYIAGAMLGFMRESVTDNVLPNFINFMEMMNKILPLLLWARAFGGTLYFIGIIIGTYVIYKTIKTNW